MIEHLVALEKPYFLWLNSYHTPYLDGVMYMISDKVPWVFFCLFFIGLLCYKQRYREVVVYLLALILLIYLCDQISSQIIKPLFHRLRPTYHPLTKDLVKIVLGHRGGRYGFISGHSANFFAFATFTALILRHRGFTLISFIIALTVCYSRIYLGVHFITDVIPAMLLGAGLGALIYLLYLQLRITFLGVDRQLVQSPFLSTHRITLLSWSLALFYLFFWTIAPLIYSTYYLS